MSHDSLKAIDLLTRLDTEYVEYNIKKFEAAKKIRQLVSLDPKNKEIPRIVKGIDDSLRSYKESMRVA